MFQLDKGAFRLFRVAGIDVFLHWSWLLVAVFQIKARAQSYSSPLWNVAEYLTIFGIVLLHEFGHALACRQVGGVAERIVLWPLGGVAYVRPPQRPGAVLWSIAAGPLVNVALVPITILLFVMIQMLGWAEELPDLDHFLFTALWINGLLLFFNILPIYPLDGGQILQALLWFIIGRARSLLVASVLGLLASLVLITYALKTGNWWLVILTLFLVSRAWQGFQIARALAKLAKMPRHREFACPSCGAAPLMGEFWVCDQCQSRFDPFQHAAVCPECGTQFAETSCIECQQRHPMAQWLPSAVPAGSSSNSPAADSTFNGLRP